ncbi:MAG: hypothetical protein ACR2OU_01445 [Thermomicrobiales bacterium]
MSIKNIAAAKPQLVYPRQFQWEQSVGRYADGSHSFGGEEIASGQAVVFAVQLEPGYGDISFIFRDADVSKESQIGYWYQKPVYFPAVTPTITTSVPTIAQSIQPADSLVTTTPRATSISGKSAILDLASATVLGPFTGEAGARLVYDNGTAGVSSVPNAAPLQSADGVSLQEQPAKNGTSVFACTTAGSCVDATSDSADGEHTDTAIGWVNGSTMIYQRILADGSYEYRAADVTGGGNASGDQVIGTGGTELARSGSVFIFRDGLLVESNGGWVIVTAQQAYLQPASSSGPRTLVRIFNIDPMRVAYVSGGQLVIQNIYSSELTTIPFTGVDYDLSPNLDQVVVSTGSGIEILDMTGQVVETFPNVQNISIGSVLWVNNTIEFVDLTTGEIRSIDVP